MVRIRLDGAFTVREVREVEITDEELRELEEDELLAHEWLDDAAGTWVESDTESLDDVGWELVDESAEKE